MTAPRRILWIAFHYPPLATAGTHRSLGLTRYLPGEGWMPVVLAAEPRGDLPIDEALCTRIPPAVAVHRVPAPDVFQTLARWRGRGRAGSEAGAREGGGDLGVWRVRGETWRGDARPPPRGRQGWWRLVKDGVTWPLKVPDAEWGFARGVRRAGRELARRERPDAILASGPPHTALLAACAVARAERIPLVLDLRDPWASNPFLDLPWAWLRRRNERLERRTLHAARLVIANTARAAAELRRRHPALAERIHELPNGFDPELRAGGGGVGSTAAGEDRERHEDPGEEAGGRGVRGSQPPAWQPCRFLHAGSLYGRRRVDRFLEAVAAICREAKGTAGAGLEVSFLGAGTEAAGPHVARLGLAAIVCRAGPVSHREAMQRMSDSDVLLLCGVSGEVPENQVPGKVFEYLALGKPILALSKAGGAIEDVLRRAGGMWWRADPDDGAAIERVLREARDAHRRGQLSPGKPAPGLDAFTHPALARRLAGLLEGIA